MTLREAAQQALEVLSEILDTGGSFDAEESITALRTALAQDMQEWTGIPGTNVRVKIPPPLMWGGRLIPQTDDLTVPRNVFYTPPERTQTEQEPVAWMSPGKERLEFSRPDTVYGSHTIPLFTHPPRREWQGLTDEEIKECLPPDAVRLPPGWEQFARAVERKVRGE